MLWLYLFSAHFRQKFPIELSLFGYSSYTNTRQVAKRCFEAVEQESESISFKDDRSHAKAKEGIKARNLQKNTGFHELG